MLQLTSEAKAERAAAFAKFTTATALSTERVKLVELSFKRDKLATGFSCSNSLR